MKIFLKLFLIAVLFGFGYGYYLLQFIDQPILGQKIIGFSVVGLVVLMFVFITYRYTHSENKSKQLFMPTQKNDELEEWIKNKN